MQPEAGKEKSPGREPPAKPWPLLRWGFADAAGKGGADFTPNGAAERRYERQLTSVAGRVGSIMRGGGSPEAIERTLREYAEVIEPWARQSAANMAAGVNRKNLAAWQGVAKRMGLDMRRLTEGPGIGEVLRKRIDDNVAKIKSLSLDAADEVAKIVRDNMAAGSRADDLAKRIAEKSGASLSRARTIARTEVSKTQTALTQERAQSVGSTGYIWRTAKDGDVRDSHRAMEGTFVKWAEPPKLDGMTGHAGEFPNDRCYPEPVVPREDADGNRAGAYKPPLQTRAAAEVSGEKTLYSVYERQETSRVIPHAPQTPLVGVERASFDKRKLTKYSLDMTSERGRHKARVWQAALGATQEDADMIYDQVMALLPYTEAVHKERDSYGERFNVVVPVTGPNGKTVDVLTSWIYDSKDARTISMRPRLVSIRVAGRNKP